MRWRVYVGIGAERKMPYDLKKTEKPNSPENVALFERLAEAMKYQSALSIHIQRLRAARAEKL